MKTAAIAMSGGVDSTVAALLLREEGYDVHGFFLRLAQPDFDRAVAGVRLLTHRLDIPLEVVDASRVFQEKVLDYFSESYRRGLTPNPCALCNRRIKFGLLLEHVLDRGMEFLATGHYARIVRDQAGLPRLYRGSDPTKDQSYFLARLTTAQLENICFPHGGRTKEEVYRLARGYGLPHEKTDESQDVCFLKGTDASTFLAERDSTPLPGEIVTADGKKLGCHRGIPFYTVGQRRGLGIPDATPYYVLRIDADANRIIVGKKEKLLHKTCLLDEINWFDERPPSLPLTSTAQIRHRHRPRPATLEPTDTSGILRLVFHDPIAALTPGQFAVFYDNEQVVGSGRITAVATDSA